MLRDALATPLQGSDRAGTLLVGGLLSLLAVAFLALWALLASATPVALVLLPVALLPAALVRGYFLRVLATSVRGDPDIPSFVDWGGLVRAGFASFLVSALALLPGVVLAGGTLIAAIGLDMGPMAVADPDLFAGLTALLAALLAVGWVVVAAYLHPAMQALLATRGLRAAVSPRAVGGLVLENDYAVGWALGVTVLSVGGPLALATAGLLVGFPLAFYAGAVAYGLFGRGATAVGASPAEGDAESTTSPSALAGPPEPDPSVQVGRDVGATGGTPDGSARSEE